MSGLWHPTLSKDSSNTSYTPIFAPRKTNKPQKKINALSSLLLYYLSKFKGCVKRYNISGLVSSYLGINW